MVSQGSHCITSHNSSGLLFLQQSWSGMIFVTEPKLAYMDMDENLQEFNFKI